jgi:PKD repeat protein
MKNLLLLSALFVTVQIFSQHNLYRQFSEEEINWHQEQMATFQLERLNRSVNDNDTIYQIPVVVHILHDSVNEAQNVTDEEIAFMMENLNNDFARLNADTVYTRPIFQDVASDVDIRFVLAQTDPDGIETNGIHRVVTDHGHFDASSNYMDPYYTASGGTNAWDTELYFNIWICDLTQGTGWGLDGYAFLPGSHGEAFDGVVIDYVKVSNSEYFSRLTHEVGHYFGLFHLFGDQTGNCSLDDGFIDTPICSSDNFGVTCNVSAVPNTCDDGPDDLPDQYENFMTFSSCQNMFTNEQALFMVNTLEYTRSSLLENMLYLSPLIPEFTANVTYAAIGEAIQFQDNSYTYNGITSWQWDFGDGTTSSLQNPMHSYSEPGFYNVQLFLNDDLNTSSNIINSYIEVYNPNSVGINNLSTEKWFSQNKNEIVVNSPESQSVYMVEIFDLLGRCMYKNKFTGSKTSEKINTESFTKGVYVLQVSSSKTRLTQKVLIE